MSPADTETDTAQIIDSGGGTVQRIIPPKHILHDEGGEDPIVEEYWVPYSGGHVRLVSEDCPGTLGRPVARGLGWEGDPLETDRESLLETIRKHHRIAMHNAMAEKGLGL